MRSFESNGLGRTSYRRTGPLQHHVGQLLQSLRKKGQEVGKTYEDEAHENLQASHPVKSRQGQSSSPKVRDVQMDTRKA